MADITIQTKVPRKQLGEFLRQLAKRYAGTMDDFDDVSENMRSRLAKRTYELAEESYEQKREGGRGNDGVTWAGHSQNTLAYTTPFKGQRGRPLAGKKAPGNKDGLMSSAQITQWWKIYSQTKARVLKNFPLGKAKQIAAKVAWSTMKRIYGDDIAKINHRKFGLRKRGQYYIGDRSGWLFESVRAAPGATDLDEAFFYRRRMAYQKYENNQHSMTLGSRVPYAAQFDKKRPIFTDKLTPYTGESLAESIGDSMHYAARVAAEGDYLQ